MLCGLLLKLMYFELQGHIGEHAPLACSRDGLRPAPPAPLDGHRGRRRVAPPRVRRPRQRLAAAGAAIILRLPRRDAVTRGHPDDAPGRGAARRRVRGELRIAVRLAGAGIIAGLVWLPDAVHAMDIVLVAAAVMLADFLFEFYGRRPPLEVRAKDVELARPSVGAAVGAPEASPEAPAKEVV
ncbi:prolyl 4-hydroxylase alpha-subunit [Aureococcus anophagefferens]|nr:prolyl 4-hydroxylase alpha-subunit [Aureococcus anophagefferens]